MVDVLLPAQLKSTIESHVKIKGVIVMQCMNSDKGCGGGWIQRQTLQWMMDVWVPTFSVDDCKFLNFNPLHAKKSMAVKTLRLYSSMDLRNEAGS